MSASLGINLTGLSYFQSEIPFANVAKMSSPWVSNAPNTPYGGGPPLTLDVNGNILTLQPDCWASKIIRAKDLHAPKGQYTILYDGEGTLTPFASPSFTSVQPGQILVDFDNSTAQLALSLTATNPSNPLRNLRVILPGITDQANASNPWNPAFLSCWQGVACLRMMDWMATNNSVITSWSQRPILTLDTYMKAGVPAELLCDLANRLSCDLWLCIPHAADDGYIGELAYLVANSLNPALKVWLEYSNETWNGSFKQNAYVNQMGSSLGYSTSLIGAGWCYTMQRARQIWAVWKDVLTDVVRVLASQAANSWVCKQTLLFRNGFLHADALAIAPYLGCTVTPGGTGGGTPSPAMVDGMTPAQFIAYVQQNCLPKSVSWIQQCANVAKNLGLGLVAYEGGQAFGAAGAAQSDPTASSLLAASQTDPTMANLYQAYFQAWQAVGGGLFNYFQSPSPWSKWGYWGITQYPDEIAANPPKWAATTAWAKSLGQTIGVS